jgi:EAL domain-containing protein (putative c-di-GMP-specific phosphodiesterase class I)/GGDEF domain-containing protein
MASEPHGYSRDLQTGLIDSSAAREMLEQWRAEAGEGEAAPVHALLVGLGRFDTVNLAYGEAAGDGALAEVARRILHFAADEFADGQWFAARLGGGKFLLAAREACSRERWQWLGEALADALAHPMPDIGQAGTVRLWPRVALMRVLAGERPAHVLDRLAQTLARAERRHGSRVLWADGELALPGQHAAALEADLLAALDRDEIALCFQPQFRLSDDRLVGAEALARWQHPRLGRIGASALFAIAERADHVAHLSRHIAQAALAEAARWPGAMRLSLNLTPADLAAGDFAAQFIEVVRGSGFDPARLTLEITEQVLLADLDRSARALATLKAAGMRIALDDFGAGFCNFRYLKVLPLDYLKLDRAMVEGIAEDPRDLAVLRAIVALAGALDLQVIAEGIESEAQRAVVAAEGCRFYQGFLRSAPLSGEAFLRLASSGAVPHSAA